MIVVVFIFMLSGHFTYMNLFRDLLLTAGVFCEWLYFRIFRSFENAKAKTSWIYSIILNIVFILYYTIDPKDPLKWPLAMALYPVFYLMASCYALLTLHKPENFEDVGS